MKKGSVLGGTLLIGGSCIGAGMLGLPIVSGLAGFFPSLVMLLIAFAFMTTTALLLVEVDAWFPRRVNFISMVTEMLGPLGRVACWILYLFLFYAILVAYIAASGEHVSSLFRYMQTSMPVWMGSLFFVILFGSFVYLGTRSVDLFNRFLMTLKIACYCLVIGIGMNYLTPSFLVQTNMKYLLTPLPLMMISFGFHNMIPTLSHYLGGDIKRIKQSILGGAFFILVVYLLWQVVALGSIPLFGDNGVIDSFQKGIDAAQSISNRSHNGIFSTSAQLLAFFAILTSFLAQTLSLVHFLADGMNIKTSGTREKGWICLLALLPPLLFALYNPGIFYKALDFAGGVCTMVLFGILPVLMVWRGRYFKELPSPYTVSGGKPLLLLVFLIALLIALYQLLH